MEQNLFIVKEVSASIQSISKLLLEKCNDLEQAIVGVSSIRNEQLAKVMIEQAIKQTLESFESTKKNVEDNRVILAKLLPEENRVQPKEEEESSESIDPALLESDSESFFLFEEEEEEKNTNKKRIFNEDDEYEFDDGFVQSDSVEPEIFKDSKYDKVFGVDHLNTPKKKKKKKSLRRSKRKNKGKIELYSDVPENEQYGDDVVEDLMVEEPDPDERANRFSAMDQGDCCQFLKSLREDSIALKSAIQASPWFKKRYNNILNTVKDNIGLQGHNRDALMVWDHIAEDAFKAGDDMPKISKGVIDEENNICCFCNNRRKCTWLLELRGILYPVGTKCGELVKAVTYFFFMLQEVVKDLNMPSSDAIDELDKAIYEVQEAHAGKARR